MTDQFEVRLARNLRLYADELVRPADPLATAMSLVAARPRASRLAIDLQGAGPWLRLGLAVALVALALVALTVAGGGSPPQPTHVLSLNEPAVSPFDARPVEAQALVLGGRWVLDFAASGLPDRPSSTPFLATLSLWAELTFNETGWIIHAGYGGGCGEATGPYRANARDIDMSVQTQRDGCEPSLAEILDRMEAATSFGLSDCSGVVRGAIPECATLTISDRTAASQLVFRQDPQ